jgi:hypothetical protein
MEIKQYLGEHFRHLVLQLMVFNIFVL